MARLYSNLKFLGHTSHLDALKERSVVAPVHMRIKPMNHCNHNCWYCAYRVDNLQLGEDIDLKDVLPEDKMFEIVDDVVDMGVKAVTFSGGGEPLLYKPLPEVVKRLAENGIKVASLTNGSNLKGKMAEAFAEHGTWIRISVDAWDNASYSKAREIPDGSFTKLLYNMQKFSAMDSPCVMGVSFIIGKDNHDHIFDACAQFKKAGANHVKLSAAVVANEVEANNAYHRDFAEAINTEIERVQTLDDENFAVINHYHEMEDRFAKSYTFCPFLQFLTVIGADCNVYTCQDKAFNQAGLLGSIKDRSFKDFWFSDEARERLYALDPSKSCNHHCVTHGKNLAIIEQLSLDPDHAVFV